MNRKPYQQKSTRGRLLLLTLLGIAMGAVLYLFIFEQTPGESVTAMGVPPGLTRSLNEGQEQIERSDYAAAEKTFQALTGRYPQFPQPYNNLAVVYASQGQLESARKALEQALAIHR